MNIRYVYRDTVEINIIFAQCLDSKGRALLVHGLVYSLLTEGTSLYDKWPSPSKLIQNFIRSIFVCLFLAYWRNI